MNLTLGLVSSSDKHRVFCLNNRQNNMNNNKFTVLLLTSEGYSRFQPFPVQTELEKTFYEEYGLIEESKIEEVLGHEAVVKLRSVLCNPNKR